MVQSKVYDHIEEHLGTISTSWKLDEDPSIQVLKFENELKEGVVTYVTLGLSNTELDIGTKHIRQELVFAANEQFERNAIASFLLTFAMNVRNSTKGLLRGEFVEGKPLINNVKATGIYASIPVFWESTFHEFEVSTPPTIFVWLMPILQSEALFVKEHGWNAFEDKLVANDVDYWNLNRTSVL
jgi:hypothetical protein